MASLATGAFIIGAILLWRGAYRLRDRQSTALWAAAGALELLLGWLYLMGYSPAGANVPWDDFIFFERLPAHLAVLFILGLCWHLPSRVSRSLIAVLIVIAGGYGLLEISGPLLLPVYGSRLDETVAPALSGAVDTPTGKSPPVELTQSTGWTCGPAALAWAMQLKGLPVSEKQAAQLTATTPFHGTGDRGIVRAAHRLGMPARIVRKLSYEELTTLPHPCLVTWSLGGMVMHFIVVIEADERGVQVGDPMMGRMEYTKEEFLQKWQRNAVVF